jgi:nitrate/nitrite transporter NarK
MRQVNEAERRLIEAGRPKAQGARRAVPWSEMAGSFTVWSLCLMYGFNGFSGNFFTSMLPLYLREHRHLPLRDAAWISALPLAAGSIACILGGSVSDWVIRRWGNRTWGRRSVGLLGMALAGLAFLSVIWAREVWFLGLLLTATFSFSDLSMGPAWAACADVGERYAGTLSGAMNMIGALAGACGAALAGYLFRMGHAEMVFLVFAGVYLLAALCWLGVDVTKQLAGRPEAGGEELGAKL